MPLGLERASSNATSNTGPDKDTEIWLYCGGGYRSVLAADNIQKMGYTNVVSVDGGFRAWLDRGNPVETPNPDA